MKKLISTPENIILIIDAPTVTAPIDECEELRIQVGIQKSFVEVTERLYYQMLEAVPPIYLPNGIFMCGECYSGDLYYTFVERSGKYYGCICNRNFAINNSPK